MNKVYVANINWKLTDADLEKAFQKCGSVISAKIIKDFENDRSRGFGFVEMSNEEEAMKAIHEMNGAELAGRELVVREAKPQEKKPRDFSNKRDFKSRDFRDKRRRDRY